MPSGTAPVNIARRSTIPLQNGAILRIANIFADNSAQSTVSLRRRMATQNQSSNQTTGWRASILVAERRQLWSAPKHVSSHWELISRKFVTLGTDIASEPSD